MNFKKCGGIESLSRFGSNGANVMVEHKKIASKLKRNNTKIISILCHNHRFARAILPFFKERATFLMGKKN